MNKYEVVKVQNNKIQYIADIIEASNPDEAIKIYINKIISYWGYCVYTEKDFNAFIN